MDNEMKKAESVKTVIIPDEKDLDQIVSDHVVFSMIAGAIPIPVLDILAISAIQIDMLRKIAKKYELDFDDESGKSIVSSIIGSTIGTSIGRAGASAIKVIPGIGTILGVGSQVTLAGITTFAIGHIFNIHFKNQKPIDMFNLDEVKETFEELLKKGKEFVENIQKQTKTTQKDMKMETSLVIKKMAEKGIIKQGDYEKIKKELEKE